MGREEWKKKLLESDVEDLFSFSIPQFALPEKARLFKSLTCEICNEELLNTRCACRTGKRFALTVLNRMTVVVDEPACRGSRQTKRKGRFK